MAIKEVSFMDTNIKNQNTVNIGLLYIKDRKKRVYFYFVYAYNPLDKGTSNQEILILTANIHHKWVLINNEFLDFPPQTLKSCFI